MKISKQPFIKWSGSKRTQAEYIVSQLPKQIDTYYECFLGGGSVLHELLNQIALGNIQCKHIVCNDINWDLIAIWNLLKDKNTRKELFDFYCELHRQLKERAEYIDGSIINKEHVKKCQSLYYETRDRYNKMIDENNTSNERAMIFYWLTRTCFNGLIRYNSKNGHFNTSFHTYGRFGIIPNKLQSVIDSWTDVIDLFIDKGGTIEFLNKSYDEVICNAKPNDIVYMDPPYENADGMYFCNGFDTERFWQMLQELNTKNVCWLLSYDGKSGNEDKTVAIPMIYKRHEYVNSGKSSFRKLKSLSTKDDLVQDSLYMNF